MTFAAALIPIGALQVICVSGLVEECARLVQGCPSMRTWAPDEPKLAPLMVSVGLVRRSQLVVNTAPPASVQPVIDMMAARP